MSQLQEYVDSISRNTSMFTEIQELLEQAKAKETLTTQPPKRNPQADHLAPHRSQERWLAITALDSAVAIHRRGKDVLRQLRKRCWRTKPKDSSLPREQERLAKEEAARVSYLRQVRYQRQITQPESLRRARR